MQGTEIPWPKPKGGKNFVLRRAVAPVSTKEDVLTWFSLDAQTGQLKTARVLDREVTPEVKLFIEVSAEEKRIPPGLSLEDLVESPSVELRVTIVDVNDQKPSFKQSSFSAEVVEGVEKGHVVLKMPAEDSDLGDSVDLRRKTWNL